MAKKKDKIEEKAIEDKVSSEEKVAIKEKPKTIRIDN